MRVYRDHIWNFDADTPGTRWVSAWGRLLLGGQGQAKYGLDVGGDVVLFSDHQKTTFSDDR